ncbi:MAG: helix-turn-helix transcriptional regulator [Jannaschia sp.]
MSDDDDGQDRFDPDATTFGDRLTGAREAVGMSQHDLATRIGIKVKTLRAWEDDLSAPRANRLSILCGLLNVSLIWLMTGRGQGLDDSDPSSQDGDLLAEVEALRRETAALSDRLFTLGARLRARMEADI